MFHQMKIIVESIFFEKMILTANMMKLGRHLIQDFEPRETTPEASLFSLSVRFMVWILSKNGRKKRHRLLAYNVKRRL